MENEHTNELPEIEGQEAPSEVAQQSDSTTSSASVENESKGSLFSEDEYEGTETTASNTEVVQPNPESQPAENPIRVEAETVSQPKPKDEINWVMWGCVLVILIAAAVMIMNVMKEEKE
jgi:hypothetical protein